MSKNNLKAQLRYHEMDDGKEGYAVNVFVDGKWEMDTWFPLVAKIGADKVGAENEHVYIHWALLRKLSVLQHLGYDIDLDF